MYGPSPAERIAMARRLIARNRSQEALDLLNEAVRQDPRHPETYETRADVFELMGLYPHAQADRRKAAEIRATSRPATPPPPPPPPPPEPAVPAVPPEPAPPPEPEAEPAAVEEPAPDEDDVPDEIIVAAEEEEGAGPDAVGEVMEEEDDAPEIVIPSEPESAPVPSFIQPDREPAAAPPPPDPEPPYTPPQPPYDPEPEYPPPVPSYIGPPRPSVTGAMLRAASVVLFALGVFIAGGVGVFLALDAVQGDDNPSSPGVTATPTALDSATDSPGNPTQDGGDPGTVEDALRGDPYGFSSVQTAWESAGFTVTVGDFSQTVTGFSEDAVDVTISRDGLSMEMSVLMYDGSDLVGSEWNLNVPVTPLEGEVPPGAQAWYNANVVVVVRITDDTLKPDALDAFLDLG